MTTLTTAQAAALLGVDVATIRRRIHAGTITAQKGTGGRYQILVPEDRAYLASLTVLLAEVRRHLDDLQRQVETQRGDLDRASREREQLEDLVLSLGRPRLRAGSAKATEPVLVMPGMRTAVAASRWADLGAGDDKKGLGASLVLTGVVALAVGVMLHLALRTHAVDSEVHLGYILGLVGLLLLLIGLLIVY